MKEFTDIIFNTVIYFLMWFLTIYIHEAGHYITAKMFNVETNGFRIQKIFNIIPIPTAVNVRFYDNELENVNLLDMKYLMVIIGGIISGAIPVIIYITYQNSSIVIALVGLIYIYMCSSDLMRIWEYINGGRPYQEFTMRVDIPESQEECDYVYPNCSSCAYFMEKECSGDKSQFSLIYKPTDAERLMKVLKERYGSGSLVDVTTIREDRVLITKEKMEEKQ